MGNFLKSKENVVSDRLGSVHEAVFKMGDVYKVKTTIEIPKSVINAFVSKAKKENGVDPRENWSDTDLAELFVDYISTNFMNIESLPINSILGTNSDTNTNDASATLEPEELEDNTDDIDDIDDTIQYRSEDDIDTPTGEIEM